MAARKPPNNEEGLTERWADRHAAREAEAAPRRAALAAAAREAAARPLAVAGTLADWAGPVADVGEARVLPALDTVESCSEPVARAQPESPADAMRPVVALGEAADFDTGDPPTAPPQVEWLAPTDLLVDARYQRDLSEASHKLIRRIVEGWDWRRFKPPVIAWTERGFEIIDGQHTAIAAATHPSIDKIPVLVVEAAELQERAAAFIGHNKDRLNVAPVQLHHAAVAAGDETALTVDQVCQRAGVTVMRNVYGARTYKPGETIAIGAITALVGRRHAKGAREVLEVLVQAGVAPIAANAIKAVELLMFDPDYAGQFEPAELAKAIQKLGDEAEKEARLFVGAHQLPLWKGLAATWFKKTRKRS